MPVWSPTDEVLRDKKSNPDLVWLSLPDDIDSLSFLNATAGLLESPGEKSLFRDIFAVANREFRFRLTQIPIEVYFEDSLAI